MAKNAKINVAIMPSTKARLVAHCHTHDITMGDVVDDALKSFFERQDREYTAPDLVLDRLNQLTLSVMQVAQAVGEIKDRVVEDDE